MRQPVLTTGLRPLDLLDGRDTARARLAMVGSKPIPFPPEPLRSALDWAGLDLPS